MGEPTEELRRAEQDSEYLRDAHVLIAGALETFDRGADVRAGATWVLEHLAAAGWHLLNAEDAEKTLDAYVVQEVRAGRFLPATSRARRDSNPQPSAP